MAQSWTLRCQGGTDSSGLLGYGKYKDVCATRAKRSYRGGDFCEDHIALFEAELKAEREALKAVKITRSEKLSALGLLALAIGGIVAIGVGIGALGAAVPALGGIIMVAAIVAIVLGRIAAHTG